MATPLKNMYDAFFFERLCPVLNEIVPSFDERRFVYRVFDTQWPDETLTERVRHITEALHPFMPSGFPAAAKLIVRIAARLLETGEPPQQFRCIFLQDYLAHYGANHFEHAMEAIGDVTKLVSGEFAIRTFLVTEPKKTLAWLERWTTSDSDAVRRLASEGCRPRLPWAPVVRSLTIDPSPILPVLENLRADPSPYVRRSVANNLNDIAKDHPDVVLHLASHWDRSSPETNWIIKRGCRTLLRRGVENALALHGMSTESECDVVKLSYPTRISMGTELDFNFTFANQGPSAALFRLDYAIDYITASGRNARSIFHIGEYKVSPAKPIVVSRRKSFKDLSTRKHFSGLHRLRILVNGREKTCSDFVLQ
jgi:3-methyladenine DNA glycosylase AlkC